MTKLTTHVLDTATGVPAASMALRLYRLSGSDKTLIVETATNSDGRCNEPLLSGTDMVTGTYELEFEAGAYFGTTATFGEYAFLDVVVIRFGIGDSSAHYHVPLLVSPFSYSTYRGS